MEIVNIVATVDMKTYFYFDELLEKIPNSKKAHCWVKARIPPYNKYTAFYGSGKFLITGAKSKEELLDIINNTVYYLKEHGINNDIKNININNCVLIDQLDFDVNLVKLITELKDYDASYEPEQFPGLTFKDQYGITYLIFSSGKITITGVKSLNNFEKYVAEFKELIREKSNK